jgi:glycosyltransferase involved in cell wall biosynthesis
MPPISLDEAGTGPAPIRARWPAISVVVPTRDRPELLRRSVQSILGQRYEGEIECVVVFDQSDPVDIGVASSHGRRVRAIRNTERTPGLAGARNAGVLAAGGELVAFCDDDDDWLLDKLQLQVELLQSNPGIPMVACGIYVVYQGREIPRVPDQSPVTFRHLLRDRVMEVNPCTILVDRTVLLERIGLVDEMIPGGYGEDYEWLLRAAQLAPVPVVPRPLVRIHWHGSSLFAERWHTIISALQYLLDKYPEFREDRHGLARIQGQIAFAHAAAGQRRQARRWAGRTLWRNWRERRAYLALAMSAGVLRADTVMRLARAAGRGI